MSPWTTLRYLVTSPWIRASLAMGLTASAAVFVVQVRPDCMLVEHVVFEGTQHASPASLRHLADVHNGTTIWTVDPEAVARGVARHPWVRSAEATRHWPDTVVVTVDEYAPAAVLHYDRDCYVDADGTPFLCGDLPDYDYPQLTGIAPELAQRHPGLPRLVVRSAIGLVGELESRGIADAHDISEVAFSETRGLTVFAGRSRVLFGLERTEEQLDRLGALISRGDVDLSEPLWVDLAPSTVAIVHPLDPSGT